MSLPHPFHPSTLLRAGPSTLLRAGADRAPAAPLGGAHLPAVSPPAPSALPARYSETARFSAMLSAMAVTDMLPVVSDCRIASGARSFSASRDGVRPSG